MESTVAVKGYHKATTVVKICYRAHCGHQRMSQPAVIFQRYLRAHCSSKKPASSLLYFSKPVIDPTLAIKTCHRAGIIIKTFCGVHCNFQMLLQSPLKPSSLSQSVLQQPKAFIEPTLASKTTIILTQIPHGPQWCSTCLALSSRPWVQPPVL